MGIESFSSLKIRKIETEQGFDIEKALESPESIFYEKEPTENDTQEINNTYEHIFINHENFIGSGNAGVVFNESDKHCLKCVWEKADVEIKNKRFDLLPARLQRLRNIQDYFSEIRNKQRQLRDKGFNFELDNGPLREAGLQKIARKILENEGLEHMIPQFHSMFHIEKKNEGKVEEFPYDSIEDVYSIYMDKVPGEMNLEDMIMKCSQDSRVRDIISDLDIDSVGADLKKALTSIHKYGLSHKDLSLRNIMIDFKTKKPVLIDFGKSKFKKGEDSNSDEEEQLAEIMNMLKRFKLNPDSVSRKLKASYNKMQEKFN
ncbi:hypothetical protein GF382_00030 [Candidatus Falkowbacteria bacterium]|nr:hypothetical protein [Candidatus Falkowbacteria bacterium]